MKNRVLAFSVLGLCAVAFLASDSVLAQVHDHSLDSASAEVHTSTTEQDIDFWTCSMHPQIRLPKAGKCPICNMSLIPVYREDGAQKASGEDSQVSLTLSARAEELAEVATSAVEKKAVNKKVRLLGILDYDETRLTNITAWVPGRIDRMFVDYTGIRVNKGDHMVELYSPELISSQEELIQAAKSLGRLSASSSELVKRSTRQALAAARDKLTLLGLTRTQVQEIETRGNVQDRVTIFAPTSGVVVERSATEGMYVVTGTKIYSIADLSNLWLNLDAYESDLPWIRYGQEVEFETQAVPGKVFRGMVSFISPVVSPDSRTVKVRVSVDNKDGSLKPGLFVKGVIKSKVYAKGQVIDTSLSGKYICPMHPEIVSPEPGTCPVCGMSLVSAEDLGYLTEAKGIELPLVIPASAPLLTGARAVVYVKDATESRYELREVVLGPRVEDDYIVEKGLKEGELVVINGAFKIDADLQIKGRASMMQPRD